MLRYVWYVEFACFVKCAWHGTRGTCGMYATSGTQSRDGLQRIYLSYEWHTWAFHEYFAYNAYHVYHVLHPYHAYYATLNYVHTSCISGATDTMRNTHTVYNIQCIPQVTEVQCIPCVIPVPSIPQSHSYFALYAYIAFVTRILCVPRL